MKTYKNYDEFEDEELSFGKKTFADLDREPEDEAFVFEYDEEMAENIRCDNSEYLEIFEDDLEAAGVDDDVINRHLSYVDLYLNHFLLHEDILPMEEGTMNIDMFLGDYFIRKYAGATPKTIKSAAGSIKKFYRCMAKHGNIEQDDYDYLSLTVEEKMDEWQRICERHNDPSEDDPLAEFPI